MAAHFSRIVPRDVDLPYGTGFILLMILALLIVVGLVAMLAKKVKKAHANAAPRRPRGADVFTRAPTGLPRRSLYSQNSADDLEQDDGPYGPDTADAIALPQLAHVHRSTDREIDGFVLV